MKPLFLPYDWVKCQNASFLLSVFYQIWTESYLCFPAYEQNRRPENTDTKKPVFWHILRSEYLNVKRISHIMPQDQNGKISTVMKGNRLCIKYMLTVFNQQRHYLNWKYTGHKFILRPGVMYCQVRSWARWSSENTGAVLQPIWKHFSLVSYRNQLIVTFCSSIDWFLYNNRICWKIFPNIF